MKKVLLSAYLILIHLLLVLMLCKSDFLARVAFYLNREANHPEELSRHYQEKVTFHRRMDGNITPGALIVIGDSLVEGLNVSALANNAINYGIGGDTTTGVLQRLFSYQSLKQASVVALAIGVNDLKYRDNQQIIANYAAILAHLSPGPQVLISAVLPVDEHLGSPKAGWQQRIADLNRDLLQLSQSRPQVTFVDASQALADATGRLKAEYHIGDGLHLNVAGNAQWIKQLHPVIAQMQAKTALSVSQLDKCWRCVSLSSNSPTF